MWRIYELIDWVIFVHPGITISGQFSVPGVCNLKLATPAGGEVSDKSDLQLKQTTVSRLRIELAWEGCELYSF